VSHSTALGAWDTLGGPGNRQRQARQAVQRICSSRCGSTVTAAAAAAGRAPASFSPVAAGAATAAVAVGSSSSSRLDQQQWPSAAAGRPPGPLDSVQDLDQDQDQDQDHLADLAEYPLGSLASLDEAQDNVPAWIQAFAPEFADKYSSPSFAAAAAVAAAPAAVASAAAAAAAAAARAKATKVVTGRLGTADAAVMGGNYLSNEQMHAIESGLFDSEGNEQPDIPFCNAMFEKLHPSPAGGDGKSSGDDAADIAQRNRRWDMRDELSRSSASEQQFADWVAAEKYSRSSCAVPQQQRPPVAPTGMSAAPGAQAAPATGFCNSMADSLQQQQQQVTSAVSSSKQVSFLEPDMLDFQDDNWGQEQKRRSVKALHELEDRVIGPEPEGQYKPFCENMFQKLHPDQPTLRPSYVARAMQQQEKEERLKQQRSKQEGGKQ